VNASASASRLLFVAAVLLVVASAPSSSLAGETLTGIRARGLVRCGAYTSDSAQLAAARLRAPGGRTFLILPERISKEPLGPVVRRGDDDWLTLVRWVLFALLVAEEKGITKDTARNPDLGRALGTDRDVARALGTDPDWARRAVQSAGNYGERDST